MTNYLGKSCSFCLPRVPFVSCRRFVCLVISLFGFEGRIWDLIVSVPDHCLPFYFPWELRDLRTVENGYIFPLFAKNGSKSFYFLTLKMTLQLLWFLYCMMAVEPTLYW